MAAHELLVFILVLLLVSSVSDSLSSSTQLHDLSCNRDLPPPFAYNGAPNGFEVKCKQGKNFLQLPNFFGNDTLYELKNINVSEGYVTISTGPLATVCPKDTDLRYGSGYIDLEGTPFILSTRNKFTVIGCNNLMIMGGVKNITDVPDAISRCLSLCGDGVGRMMDGSCSGLGCCQDDIRGGIKTILLFHSAKFEYPDKSKGCSQVFFVDREKFRFEVSSLRSDLSVETYHDVVLEWAIRNVTCEVAKKSKSYACENNSYCYDLPNGVGYGCKCSAGYTGNPYQKGGCKVWLFASHIDECADPSLNPCVGKCTNTEGNVICTCPRGKRGDGRRQGSGCARINQLELALGVGFGTSSILIVGSLWSCWFLKKRERKKLKAKFFKQNGGLLLQNQILSQGNTTMKIFLVEELQKATNNFNETHILGQGGYGTVYKGILPDHRVVAIKKSKLTDESQVEQFINEIVILSQINHRNVVKLLGCCVETKVPLLVYEFIPNGSLYELIHNKEHEFSLSWDDRLRIATETAGALAYLHSAASIPIIHRDVKSANILLDQNYIAKVSDFGASRSVPFDQTHVTTLVQGTLGYLDPEYFHTSLLTEKSDVYSFGVVLAELMTGEMPISVDRLNISRNLASYFRSLFDENKLLKVIKPEVLIQAGTEQINTVAKVVVKCLSLKGDERPTMKEVLMELEGMQRRFQKQNTIEKHKHDKLECLLVRTHESSSLNIKDMVISRQFSLENKMTLSANFPR